MAEEYDDYDPHLIPTPEFKILQNLVKHPNASAKDAVQQIAALTNQEFLSKDWTRNTIGGDFAWYISKLILDIATNSKPSQQATLLDFVRQLQKTAIMHPRTGEQLVYDGEKLWTDFRALGFMLRTCMISGTKKQHT